ncbi:ABC transporter permease [Ancylobacter mangrovi]|uniref:ABC transporter permease n=1 Tax=Ancylobacter mangrovi TaxID=2972472 RepID=UPI002162EF51|nr:ABC transporter permease [Ancylobacter mangrovi]MCS0504009.1 ABC transporter permease [Ancylobacter mangrovi]
METSPLRWLLPVAVMAALVIGWEAIVDLNDLPPYILPSPAQVVETLIADHAVLLQSMLVTLRTTALALAFAVAGGVALALIFASARIVEFSLFPIAVILQVTPVIAIAPLMLIYLSTDTAVLVCAWIVAFFPVLANTTLGLNSVDPNLRDLFRLAGASRWQTLVQLRLPTALPYFLGGLRIAGGLALIGAVVGEIAAGSAGQGSGLAFRIVESAYRLNIPRMFAALLLISLAGILIYAVLSLISWLALRRWHESALANG